MKNWFKKEPSYADHFTEGLQQGFIVARKHSDLTLEKFMIDVAATRKRMNKLSTKELEKIIESQSQNIKAMTGQALHSRPSEHLLVPERGSGSTVVNNAPNIIN